MFRKIFFLLLFISSHSYFAQVSSEGKVQKVVLFRNQALVMRVLELNLKPGSHEILVTKLPSQLVPNSLYAESQDAEIRAARVKTQELSEDPSPEVSTLNAKIEDLDSRINHVKRKLEVNKNKKLYLQKQQEFVIGTEKLELSKGVLHPQTLKEMTLFHFEQQSSLAEEELQLQNELTELNKEKNLFVRQRNQLTATTKKSFEASIFLDKSGNPKTILKVYYLVNNASWSPLYNFYAKENHPKITVEFNAHIEQMSGEDWEGVELTLSNASPALSASSPTLSPFRISLAYGGSEYERDIQSASQSVAKKMKEAYNQQISAQSSSDSEEGAWAMNKAASEYQNLELLAKGEEIHTIKKELSENTSPSVSFEVVGKVSLQSKREQQLVKVQRFELPAQFYNIATPLLTSYVFKEAEMENSFLEVLLEGPVNAYLEGSFVGKAEIPNVSKGQFFVVGFGIDSKLKAKRELVDKKEKILGGNKEQVYNIRITLENYSKSSIPLRVVDRIPLEDEKQNIRITLDLKGNALSSEELYEKYQKPKGLLRWDLNLSGESIGSKAKILEYSYKLEFDKNQNIVLPDSYKLEQMKNEFKEIQKLRMRR
ncbi:MAG: DUF4139 domain-containing protein [Leptospiraceae bacterium]|nr:DUF4139 domain-containing protein [Leptospiraceae bacterium]